MRQTATERGTAARRRRRWRRSTTFRFGFVNGFCLLARCTNTGSPGGGGVGEVVATDSNAKLEQAQQVELKAEVEAPYSGIDSLSLKIQLVFDLHTSTQTCKVQGGREGRGRGRHNQRQTINKQRQTDRWTDRRRRKVATFLAKYFKTHIRQLNRNQRRTRAGYKHLKAIADAAGQADVDGEQAVEREGERVTERERGSSRRWDSGIFSPHHNRQLDFCGF